MSSTAFSTNTDEYDYNESETMFQKDLFDVCDIRESNTNMSAFTTWKFGDDEARKFLDTVNKATTPGNRSTQYIYNQFSRFIESLQSAVDAPSTDKITSRQIFLPIPKKLQKVILTSTINGAFVSHKLLDKDRAPMPGMEEFQVSFSHMPKYHSFNLVKKETRGDEVHTKTVNFNKLARRDFKVFQEHLYEYYNKVVELFFTASGIWWEKFRETMYPIYRRTVYDYMDESEFYRIEAMARQFSITTDKARQLLNNFIQGDKQLKPVWLFLYNTYYHFKTITESMDESDVSRIMRGRANTNKNQTKRAAAIPRAQNTTSGGPLTDQVYEDRLKVALRFRRKLDDKETTVGENGEVKTVSTVGYYHATRGGRKFMDPKSGFIFDYRDVRNMPLSIPFPDDYAVEDDILENFAERIATLYDRVAENATDDATVVRGIFGENVDTLVLMGVCVNAFKIYWSATSSNAPTISNSASLKSLIPLKNLPRAAATYDNGRIQLGDAILRPEPETPSVGGMSIPVKNSRISALENELLGNI